MDSESRGRMLCPVCSTFQENLKDHVGTHTKEEIIMSITGGTSKSSNNVQDNQNRSNVELAANNEGSSSSKFTVFSSSPLPQMQPFNNSIQHSTGTSINTVDFENIFASDSGSVKNVYIPQPTAQPLVPTTLSMPLQPDMVYRSQSSFPNVNNTTLFINNPGKPVASPNLTSSYPFSVPHLMNPSLQPAPLVFSANNHLNLSNNANRTTNVFQLKPKQNEMIPNNNSVPINNINTNLASGSNPLSMEQPPMMCMMYPPAFQQPNLNHGNSYILYGNNLIPSGNVIQEAPPAGLSYLIPDNNASNFNLNNNTQSLFSNNTGNISNFGIKQEIFPGSFVSNYPTIKTVPNNSIVQPPVLGLPLTEQNLFSNDQSFENPSFASFKKQKEALVSASLSSTAGENERTTIEVGNNIKISLPKCVFNKKERIKEIINRELVKGLLLNEDEEEEEMSNPPKNETTSEDSYALPCIPTKTFESKNICSNLPSTSMKSNNTVFLPAHNSSTTLMANEESLQSNDDFKDKSLAVNSDNVVIDLSTTSQLDSISSQALNFITSCEKDHDNVPDETTDTDYKSPSVLEDNKNRMTLYNSNFSCSTYREDLVLGAVEQVFSNDSQTETLSPSKPGPSNVNFENHVMQYCPENMCTSEDSAESSSWLNSSSNIKKYENLKNSKKHATTFKDFLKPPELLENCFSSPVKTSESNQGDDLNSETISGNPSTNEENDLKDFEKISSENVQKFTFKNENSESSGAHTEDAMSLKASETLADSDSEITTPNEDIETVGQLFYGKDCIFFDDEGTPIQFPDRSFPSTFENSIKQSEDEQKFQKTEVEDKSLVDNLFPAEAGKEEDGINEEMEDINLTIDGNFCTIVTEEDMAGVVESSLNSMQELPLKEEKKVIPCEEIVYRPFSPHASTSGIQNNRSFSSSKRSIREVLDDDEYEFEYESDCYAESDSDPASLVKFYDKDHFKNNHCFEMDQWKCSKCQQTFKSLKEKLLHSSHHALCSVGEASVDSPMGSPPRVEEEIVADLPGLGFQVSAVKLESFKQEVDKESELLASVGIYACVECRKCFSTIDQLHEHRSKAFRSRYICPLCHIEFKKRAEKRAHVKIHVQESLRCVVCNRKFVNIYPWAQHQLMHLGFSAHECHICGNKFQRKSDLEVHLRKHTGERPFKCCTCEATFITNYALKRHLLIHLEGQETECDICHKKYRNAIGLNKHKLLIHSQKKKYLRKRTGFMCNQIQCNEIFPSSKKLAWHQEIHERWPKKCQKCGDCFIHQPNLTKHIRSKHDPSYVPEGQKNTSPCPICKKMYIKSSLNLHMQIHMGTKAYACNICPKRFTAKCNFESHKWTHKPPNTRPYKCSFCEKSFHRKKFLEAHIRGHKRIRSFTCNECGKSFIHKNNYRTHVKQHTEAKRYECTHCGKLFHRKYNLDNHVRIHTGETPYECKICKKEFTQKSNFNVHNKAFHSDRHAIHEEV